MKIALIGLPGSGKTTLFTAITGLHPDEREALRSHIGTVSVPDERLDNLATLLGPKKLTYSELTFLDTHGFDLVHSKEAEGLIIVIGVFSQSAAPTAKDAQDILADLILSDLEIIEKRLPRMKKEIESGKNVREQPEYDLLSRCKAQLEKNRPLRELRLKKDQERMLHGYQFLTLKPAFFVANIGEEQLGKAGLKELEEFARKENLAIVELCAKAEEEILELAKEERQQFLEGLGIAELSEDRIIKTAYSTMELISFFTVKGDETKAWPISKGAPAIEAAGKVHTDIQRGFIKAEVINYRDFVECGNFNEAKRRGLLRLEGRDYVVQDGDIINFKFNV